MATYTNETWRVRYAVCLKFDSPYSTAHEIQTGLTFDSARELRDLLNGERQEYGCEYVLTKNVYKVHHCPESSGCTKDHLELTDISFVDSDESDELPF